MSRIELVWDYIVAISQNQTCLPIRQQSLAEHFGCSRRTIGRALTILKQSGRLSDTGRRESRIKIYQISCPRPLAGEGGSGLAEPGEGLHCVLTPAAGGLHQERHPLPILVNQNLPLPQAVEGGTRKPPQAGEGEYAWVEFEQATYTPPPLRINSGERLSPHAEQQWRLYHRTIKINLDCYDGKSGRPLLEHVYAGLTSALSGKSADELYSNVFALLRAAPYYEACKDSHWQERIAKG